MSYLSFNPLSYLPWLFEDPMPDHTGPLPSADHPHLGSQWKDTSGEQPVLRQWDGERWAVVPEPWATKYEKFWLRHVKKPVDFPWPASPDVAWPQPEPALPPEVERVISGFTPGPNAKSESEKVPDKIQIYESWPPHMFELEPREEHEADQRYLRREELSYSLSEHLSDFDSRLAVATAHACREELLKGLTAGDWLGEALVHDADNPILDWLRAQWQSLPQPSPEDLIGGLYHLSRELTRLKGERACADLSCPCCWPPVVPSRAKPPSPPST